MKIVKKILAALLAAAVVTVALSATVLLVYTMGLQSGSAQRSVDSVSVDVAIVDRFDMEINNRISDAMEGMLSIEKVYWLHDDDQVAPEPDRSKFGTAASAGELGWLLEAAEDIMEGQQIHFSTDITIAPGSQIRYYLDETIFAVTWKQPIDGGIYTFSEVKIRHPSQLRRFLAGGEYGSEIQLKTTEMAQTVNAVVASSGDFYGYRRHGVIVYDGVVRRVNTGYVDTCYIDDKGDMLFTYTGELHSVTEAQAFVDQHNIRFSMAFGPVLVDHGEVMPVDGYFLGQIEDPYPRAALCQKGPLHYLVVAVNSEPGYYRTASLFDFADRIAELDVEMAYTLDGGQTAAIVMNDKLINSVLSGSQRNISDIFYFATAVPNGE